ncbi:putative siderophore transport system permease protein YfiZ [Calidithermus terrae]|uniref:Putative siderophore transport system permease protein YfiZ n=1 Tax=Calidithermus terrae TaxID=1408545 RepID=A0A399EDU1_9DEIN|nr:iron ABC transporter permease [Calidithermus terrae]RIH82088.1 putative siderophore transport system permease protein YfiZ [Calidithermus terrae]
MTAALPSRGSRAAWLAFPLGLGLLLLAFLLSISVGAKDIPLAEVWRLVFQPDGSTDGLIVQTLRLPRAVAALAVGACLAVSGAMLQGITRNPLAGPGILGVNAGAALAILAVVVFLPALPARWFVAAAFAGGLLAAGLVYAIAVTVGLTPVRLALAGVAVGALLAASSNAILILFEERARGALFVLSGSVAGRTWEGLLPVLPWAAGSLALALLSAQLVNLLALGEDVARGLGVRVGLVRAWATALAVLCAAAATSIAGPIGFLGLMAPHLARGLVGADYRRVLPLSAVLGAAILLLADVGARLVDRPLETPVGILITAIGAPFFVHLARRVGQEK